MALAAVAAKPSDDATVTTRQRLDRRLAELKQDRTTAEADWRDITRFILPSRGRYLAATTARKPSATSSRILDPTATKAHRRLASFCMSGITSPGVPWFRLGVPDDDLADDDDVRAWLSECTRRMQRVLSSGTFYTALGQVYQEMAGFGTGPVLVMDDYEDVLRFFPLTCGEYWLGLDKNQEVDELFREYSLTVGQLVEQFGLEQCSGAVRDMWRNKRLSALIVVVHAIEPNRDRKPGRIGWQGKAYTGTYFERGGDSDKLLKVEGFHHRPFVAPRWEALAGEPYGTGPGHEALPDTKSLQAGVRQLREAAEHLVNPALQGDAKYQNAYLGQLPGDVNWITGLDATAHGGLRPIFQVPPNVAPLAAEVEGYRKAVQETFYTDLILAISQMEGVQPRNQMEIIERKQEKMLMLGPMLERFYTEALSPLIRLAFARMQRVGLLPPAPKKLGGRMVEPSFVSVLASAQKSVGTTAIEALLRLAGSMAGVWPGSQQKIDSDEVIDQFAELVDAPHKIVVPQAKVDAIRANQNKLAQQQQAADMAQKLAGGAETLSNTDVGGGQSALAAMLGRGGGAA